LSSILIYASVGSSPKQREVFIFRDFRLFLKQRWEAETEVDKATSGK